MTVERLNYGKPQDSYLNWIKTQKNRSHFADFLFSGVLVTDKFYMNWQVTTVFLFSKTTDYLLLFFSKKKYVTDHLSTLPDVAQHDKHLLDRIVHREMRQVRRVCIDLRQVFIHSPSALPISNVVYTTVPRSTTKSSCLCIARTTSFTYVVVG